MRVSEEEELMGMDILEHGINNLFGGVALAKKDARDAVEGIVQRSEASSNEFKTKLVHFFSEMSDVSER